MTTKYNNTTSDTDVGNAATGSTRTHPITCMYQPAGTTYSGPL
jgi:hypothetical protein